MKKSPNPPIESQSEIHFSDRMNPIVSPLFRVPAIFSISPELLAAESTRHGGVSEVPYASLNLGTSTADLPKYVAENRVRFWQSLGVEACLLYTSRCV